MAEIAAHHEVHATQVTAWMTELLGIAAAIFGGDVLAADGKERIRDLQAKIGELTMENSFRWKMKSELFRMLRPMSEFLTDLQKGFVRPVWRPGRGRAV